MVALGSVPEAVHAQQGEAAISKHLLEAIAVVKTVGAEVASSVSEMVVARSLTEALAARRFDDYCALLHLDQLVAGGAHMLSKFRIKSPGTIALGRVVAVVLGTM